MFPCLQNAGSKEGQTIIQIDTRMAAHLPVLDVAAYDIGAKNKEFGLDIGEVCFL